MMFRGLLIIIGLVALAGCVPQGPQARAGVAEAEQLCTQRAKRYANTPLIVADENGFIQVGLQAELPDSIMVNDFYRSCYRANTGVWPQSTPKIPASG